MLLGHGLWHLRPLEEGLVVVVPRLHLNRVSTNRSFSEYDYLHCRDNDGSSISKSMFKAAWEIPWARKVNFPAIDPVAAQNVLKFFLGNQAALFQTFRLSKDRIVFFDSFPHHATVVETAGKLKTTKSRHDTRSVWIDLLD